MAVLKEPPLIPLMLLSLRKHNCHLNACVLQKATICNTQTHNTVRVARFRPKMHTTAHVTSSHTQVLSHTHMGPIIVCFLSTLTAVSQLEPAVST